MNKKIVIVAILSACSSQLENGTTSTNLVLHDPGGPAILAAGDNNNWSDGICVETGACRVSAHSAGSSITGIDVTYYGDRDVGLWVHNDGPGVLTIAHDRTSSGGNRIHTKLASDIYVAPGYGILLTAVVDWTTDPYTPLGWFEYTDNAIASVAASTPSRTLGVAFQPSNARPVLGHYSVKIDATLTISGGQAGRVELLSDAANPPTTIRASIPCGATGTAVIGLTLTTTCGGQLSYLVRAGDFALIRTVDGVNTPTYTLVNQTEETL